ncbi:uncharacterized protein LOC116291068 [Actinia tenebrosa]|uniref:Uncharacterized protein LOC116291068 n=1 Tax=Actinia tenebrosa TaxID=6105 RepID=A0A6P8HN15_ACTTE|nr:uncharacterized protein LOC116291068 [Actinia tenebrosa]
MFSILVYSKLFKKVKRNINPVEATRIIKMGKYSKFTDLDHQVKTFRWPYWLLPLLFLSLLLVLGLFIFITIHSADRFGCLFHCEQKIDDGGVVPPNDGPFDIRRGDHNVTEHVSTKKPSTGTDSDEMIMGSTPTPTPTEATTQITVKGKLLFPSDRVPDSIPPNSHLIVKFEDSSLQDASSVVLGKTLVDANTYKKGTNLTYKIVCPKPKNHHDFYSVSATLNMGWTPTKEGPWIRHGDLFTDTMYDVKIKNNVTVYEKDITFAYLD